MLTRTIAQKNGIITMRNVRASFQTKKESKLQKAINVLQRPKDLEYKKELRRLKKF